MNDISNNNTVVYFKSTKPASIRLWHWLTFLFFTFSLMTVILASTIFTTTDNVTLVQEQVHETGGVVTTAQARSVAHEYSDKLWMLHKYFGFGLSFLMFSRIVIEVSLSKEKRLAKKIRSALVNQAGTEERKHYLFVQYSYAVFYVLFIIMASTGLVLAFEDVKWLDPIRDFAEETHGIVQWALYAYFLIHIAGVIRADLTKYSGIVSRMIHGKENV